jgi:hypothetical protein
MTQFIAIAPDVEVNGETVQAFLTGMGGFQSLFQNALQDNGIKNPQSGDWFPQQAWLNAFSLIAGKTGPATLKTIGKRIIDSAIWPPDVDNMEKALASIDVAYHMNHRGGNIGNYNVEKIGDRSVRMICNNPYPCDFDLGIIDGVMKKFAQSADRPVIQHENPEECRKNNRDICSYLITW